MARMALITGASAGIGWQLAHCFGKDGRDVVLVARRRERLDELAAILDEKYRVQTRVETADLADPAAARSLFDRLQADGVEIDYLVNNAGFGGKGAFSQSDPERVSAMVRLNVETLTLMTRLFLPGMVERGFGRVLNVASTAAFQPGPGQAVYCATKAYVLSFSEAVDAELRGSGVSVTCLCPGATETEFAKVADMEDSAIFQPGMFLASAEDVAKEGYAACMRGQRVVVIGALNKVGAVAAKFAPRRLTTIVAGKLMEK